MSVTQLETIEYLPFVKAYPALSKTYGEVSCIAGVRVCADETPEWVRLYPVPFRALDDAQQFGKYQPVSVRVSAHGGDRRPETRRPDRDSITIVGNPISTRNGWEARRRFVEPLMVSSMCEVLRKQRVDGTSLAVFRPKRVLDLLISPADVQEEKVRIAKAWAAQPSLLADVAASEKGHQLREIEQIPWTFRYRYECDDDACNGHTQSIVDWEIAAFYRQVRRYDDWQDRVKARWLGELCGNDRDTAFFVGNMHQHLSSFLVLGVWWPPTRPQQMTLGLSASLG
jgi:hypothetical protein